MNNTRKAIQGAKTYKEVQLCIYILCTNIHTPLKAHLTTECLHLVVCNRSADVGGIFRCEFSNLFLVLCSFPDDGSIRPKHVAEK
jgi:hypothetical protein